MNILITGGSGLVGTSFRKVFAHKLGRHQLFYPSSSELNLLEKENIFKYIGDHKIDFFIHAAGKVGGIQANISDPLGFYLDNLYMGLNLLEAAYECGVERGINLGSSCIYPRGLTRAIREDDLLNGELEPTNEGYALAKLSVLKFGQLVGQKDSRFQYKTIIPCNLYGPGDSFDEGKSHLIPAIIKKIDDAKREGESSVEIWGDGEAKREFLFCDDLARFTAESVINFSDLPSVINVGLGRDYSINEYYQIIGDVLGYTGEFSHDLSKPVGMKRKLVDSKKMDKLNWIERTALRDGVEATYHFYKGLEVKRTIDG